jgi:phosphatidylglycerol---prolipoprotein diacylglyceryl transferase
MYPILLHIYGPFNLYSYGCAIALGIIVFAWLANRDERRKKLMSSDLFMKLLFAGIISGVVGGRILYVISEWNTIGSWSEIFELWQGGFSILGTLIALTVTTPLLLYHWHVPIVPMLDLVALYAPLLQAIARVGCLLSGCCYGLPSSVPWAIMYTTQECHAPLYQYIHPSQLYSSLLLLAIFLFMYFVLQHYFSYSGLLATAYLMLEALERFMVDFFRGDQIQCSSAPFVFLSFHQWIALGIFISAGIAFMIFMWLRIAKSKVHAYEYI